MSLKRGMDNDVTCSSVWVAQVVEQVMLDFGSSQDLRFLGLRPMSSSTLSRETAGGFPLSLFFYPPANSLSLKSVNQSINQSIFKKNKVEDRRSKSEHGYK